MIKINQQIQAAELRVIDEQGASIGVLPLSEALKLAQEKGLDLIEISPNAHPPVARIMSFDKYRYQEEKKLKKQKARQKNQELKRVRVGVKSAEHDFQIKANLVNKFLEEGHIVEIQMTMRGREKANKEWAKQKLLDFMKLIIPEYKVIMDIRMGGYGFVIQIAPK